ncbi:MAG: glycosyltransferase family 2 protein [Bacteroidota bacterium]|nr:glycosyltransferase family 2 protein [Bacteroidota bacterium]
MPEVSIIVPNYNHAAFLQQRIDSILNQTYQDFELIILDDCSTDNSRDILESLRNHPKVSHLIFNKKNSGSPFKQWQRGIELAKGDYIWIAESDDYCDHTFLETALENLNKGDSSLSFCQSERVDENNIITGDYFYWTEDIKTIDWSKQFVMNGEVFIQEVLQYKNAIPNASAVLFRIKKFDFNKIVNYKMKGDWLFWITFLMSENLTYSPGKLNFFRSHPDTTRNQWSNLIAVRSSIEELGIKYFLYKSGFVKSQQLKEAFYKSVDISLPYYGEFKKICFELALPSSFQFYFFLRKVWLKLLRTIPSGKPGNSNKY